METRIDFFKRLSDKIYLMSVGLYVTVVAIMFLPDHLASVLGLPHEITRFVVYFVISLLRAFYDFFVIYESKVEDIHLHKFFIFAFANSVAMITLRAAFRPYMGAFSAPFAVIISRKIVDKLNLGIWADVEHAGFFAQIQDKLKLNMKATYSFYGILVGIAYTFYGIYGFNFQYVFSVAFFVAMLFEELYKMINLYEQKLSVFSLIAVIIWAAICAELSTAIVLLLIFKFGHTGQTATIASVILVKLIQQSVSQKVILRF